MNPWGYIGTGLMLSLFGGFLLAVTGFRWDTGGVIVGLLGLACALLGGVLLPIGVIAEGVRVGVRDLEASGARDLEYRQP